MQYSVLYLSVLCFCVGVCFVCITTGEMYCLPSLCAEINVSFKRFRVCIWAWRSPRPAWRCVCAFTQWTSSTDGMRGIETPFVFEGRNGSDLRPANPGHALLTSLSLFLFPSFSFPLSFLIHSFFISKLFHPHFHHNMDWTFFLARYGCNGWIDIVLQQAMGFFFCLWWSTRAQRCVKCWVSHEQAKDATDREWADGRKRDKMEVLFRVCILITFLSFNHPHTSAGSTACTLIGL